MNIKADLALNKITTPELVFGIVGPIGVNIDNVVEALEKSLKEVSYKSHVIHLTKFAKNYKIDILIDESSYYTRYDTLIQYGNEFRKLAKTPAAMSGVAITKISEIRIKNNQTNNTADPALKNAYIIRQFKRPEEIEVMRRVYGRKFIQVSVFGRSLERRQVLMDKISTYDSSPKNEAICEQEAIKLIDMDQSQKDDANGQRLSDVFHLGDVFVDGINKDRTTKTIQRFVRALFGDTKISPSKDEYGLYMANAAALRSVDLSRQVGAAIFSDCGEIVTLGCNEVPKAKGGTYWEDDDSTIFRDVERGSDPNQDRKNEIIYDLIERLAGAGFLSVELTGLQDEKSRVAVLEKNSKFKDAQIMDIIEYGRIIHAEMSAISDAAQLGRSTLRATLFCTTFPCHLCAKHIVAAGIQRVVFLEPYPKSHAHKLHSDSITFERNGNDTNKVLFEPFMGISPRRYRDIFEKKKRKDNFGKAKEWYEGAPIPLIEDKSAAYIQNEKLEVHATLKEFILKEKIII